MKCEDGEKRPRIEREESHFQINDSQKVFCLLFLLWFDIVARLALCDETILERYLVYKLTTCSVNLLNYAQRYYTLGYNLWKIKRKRAYLKCCKAFLRK